MLESHLKYLYQYTPRSDFSIVVNNYPILFLEVASSASASDDMHRMQLQASCLVRLGNALIPSLSPEFLVKAIYIGDDFQATEYTFYQRSHQNTDVEFT